MSYGFNSKVEVGDDMYHVQTETYLRPRLVIETAIFQQGLVHYVQRTDFAPGETFSAPQLEARTRLQHVGVIADLKRGALRGHGTPLTIDWSNPSEFRPGAPFQVRVRIARGQVPAANCRVAAWLLATDSANPSEPPLARVLSDPSGAAELSVALSSFPSAWLLLEAEQGLSRGSRKFPLPVLR